MVEAESTLDEPRACQSAPHPVASSDTAQRAGRVPSRLAHEVEVGNVEYKLKLIEPSAANTRLTNVTTPSGLENM